MAKHVEASMKWDAQERLYWRKLGANVALLRKRRGWSQSALAACLTHPRTSAWLSLVENGVQRMSIYVVRELARELGVSLAEVDPATAVGLG